MARKPETAYRMAVEKYIPRTVHKQAMGLFLDGTPDRYYESDHPHTPTLWIEYKFTPKLKKDGVIFLRDGKKKPFITGLQFDWIKRAVSHNIPAFFILGIGESKTGIILSIEDANKRTHINDYVRLGNKHMAEWITESVSKS